MISDLNVCTQQQIFNSETMTSFFDDSRVDFPSSKRFTRKKESFHDQSRSNKSSFNDENQLNCSIQKRTYTEESKKYAGFANTFLKTEDLLLKIALTPNKNRMVIPQICSDRTEVTISRQRCQKQYIGLFVTNGQTSKKLRIQELQAEMQVKQSEILKLVNQNQNLKETLQQKQDKYQKQQYKIKQQYEVTKKQLDNQIATLKEELRIKNEELSAKNQDIKTYKKNQQQLVREIKSANYDKLLLEKQMEELYKIKLSKQIRDIMSFRQISLMAQVEELKKIVESSKSQIQKHLEGEIRKLREEADSHSDKYKNIEVHSRVLHRKITEYQKELKERSVLFNRSYSKIKQSHSQLNQELRRIRKENIKLKQLFVLQRSNGRTLLSISPSQTPLSLSSCSSLSSCRS